MSNTAFYQDGSALDFMKEVLGGRIDLDRPLVDSDRVRFAKEIKGNYKDEFYCASLPQCLPCVLCPCNHLTCILDIVCRSKGFCDTSALPKEIHSCCCNSMLCYRTNVS